MKRKRHKSGGGKNPPKNFQCSTCPYSTQLIGNFQIHLKTHSNEKPFKCPECPFKSKAKANLKNHINNVHHPQFRFPCQRPGCNYIAKQKQNLMTHAKNHLPTRSFSCSRPNCKFSTNFKTRLVEHVRTHTGEKPFVCQFESCNFSAVNSGQLVSHTRSHTKERPYKCPEPNCEYSSAYTGHLKEHQRYCHPREGEEVPSFSCPVEGCPFTTRRRHSLKGHLVVHGDSFFKCDLCPFKTRWKEALQRHVARFHNPRENSDPDSRPFKCREPNCDYAARERAHLTRHAHTHVAEKSFKCPQEGCSYASKVRVNLYRHLKLHGEKSYACGLCPAKLADSKGLKYHIAIHTKERPFKCQFDGCSFAAVFKTALKYHENSHREKSADCEKTFSCDFPGCSFTSNYHYVIPRHYRNFHSEDRPFKCAICSFSTKTNFVLKKHKEQVHSAERPFQCPEKGSGCLYPGAKARGNLLIHIQTHKRDKNQECPHQNCGFKTNLRAYLQRHLKTMHKNKRGDLKSPILDHATAADSEGNKNLQKHLLIHEGDTRDNPLSPLFPIYEQENVKSHEPELALTLQSLRKKEKCSFCDCGFNTKYELSRHLKTHTEEKPNIKRM